MKHSAYHSFLRVASAVCAVVLLFESGVIHQSTKTISQNTHLYLANAIGMSAAVQPTELNQYTAKLAQMEQDLQLREAALTEREIAVSISGGSGASDTSTYVLASILLILLVLILLNYILDYLRVREERLLRAV